MSTSKPFVRFNLLARAASWLIGRAGVSSMNSGQASNDLAASTNLLNSFSVISPRRIWSDGTSATSDKTRAASCSALISNE